MKNLLLTTRIAVPFVWLLSACGHRADDAAIAAPPTDPLDAGTFDAVASDERTSADAPADRGFTIDMFDDFEDGNLDITVAGGRYGHWYNYDDMTEGTNAIASVT